MNLEKQSLQLNKVEQFIFTIRGERVIIDADLAILYGVTTKRLNEQVKRNKKRFPEDFMFRLTKEEKAEVVANCDHLKNIKYSNMLPNVFTEHGALMAANVLSSERAIDMSVYVTRAFIKMRALLGQHGEILKRLTQLESRVSNHAENIKAIIEAVRQLMQPPKSKSRLIGFNNNK